MKKKSSKKLPVGQWLGYAALIVLAIISIGPIWIAFKNGPERPDGLALQRGITRSARDNAF